MDKEELAIGIRIFLTAILGATIIGCGIWVFCATGRVYDVWAQRKVGESELAHAESNRKIKTLEAKAFEESAKYLAEAEIIRAKGVAEANKIIGQSLNDNEAYLRYLWIHNIENTSNQIIYVPTEAGLPILEAGKRS